MFTIPREGSENILARVHYHPDTKSITIFGKDKRFRYQNVTILSQPISDFDGKKSDSFNIELTSKAFSRFGSSRIDICLGMGGYIGTFFLNNQLHQARFNPDYYMNRGVAVFDKMFDIWFENAINKKDALKLRNKSIWKLKLLQTDQFPTKQLKWSTRWPAAAITGNFSLKAIKDYQRKKKSLFQEIQLVQ